MSHIGTPKKPRHLSSWADLTQKELRYLLWLLRHYGSEPVVVKTYLFVRLSGLHVVRRTGKGWLCWQRGDKWWQRRTLFLTAGEVLQQLQQFAFIDRLEGMDVRLEDVCGCHAVDVRLHGVSFEYYLQIEKYYQLYLMHRQERFIDTMTAFLYLDKKGKHPVRLALSEEERLASFLWVQAIKAEFARRFPNFFKKADGEESEAYDLIEQMNMQIRALTDGDLTKRKTILDTDCWDALFELDAKAREAAELKKIYDRNK